MIELISAAGEVQAFIEEQRWNFCFIGGLALQLWGENRLTLDVDLTLFAGFGSEERYIDPLLSRFAARRADARDFAIQYRVILLRASEGVEIDISLAGLPFEEEVIARSSKFEFMPTTLLRTCTAEDLVVLKAFAARPRDWLDIRGILVRQGKLLDRGAIVERLTPLVELKEQPEIVDQLRKLFESASL